MGNNQTQEGLKREEYITPLLFINRFDPFLDTPWERLHSWLLGPVKLAILGLMNFGPFKKTGKKKATIQAFFDALSWEGFKQII